MKNCRLVLTDIRLAWDKIKGDVTCLTKTHGLDWRPEDVYAQCVAGRAFCWLCDDGFVIVRPQENAYTLDRELFVWLCVSRAEDGITEYYPDICAIARDVGARRIIFESPREGFRRLANKNGWPSMTAYTLPVCDL